MNLVLYKEQIGYDDPYFFLGRPDAEKLEKCDYEHFSSDFLADVLDREAENANKHGMVGSYSFLNAMIHHRCINNGVDEDTAESIAADIMTELCKRGGLDD